MKEIIRLNVNPMFRRHLNFGNILDANDSVIIFEFENSSENIEKVKKLEIYGRKNFEESLYFGWKIKRKSQKSQLKNETTLRLMPILFNNFYVVNSDEAYNSDYICNYCQSDPIQVGPLELNRYPNQNQDLCFTLGGEIIVSKRLKEICIAHKVTGVNFLKLKKENNGNFFQAKVKQSIVITTQTIAGISPFDLSESDQDEIYKCPKGHTIGLNLISEIYIEKQSVFLDITVGNKLVGVTRGLVRPKPLIFISNKFLNLVQDKKLKCGYFEMIKFENQ